MTFPYSLTICHALGSWRLRLYVGDIGIWFFPLLVFCIYPQVKTTDLCGQKQKYTFPFEAHCLLKIGEKFDF